jgi:long-chain acyl-CoA synthetase
VTPHPWLAHYDAHVPPSLAPYPERTLLDYLDETVREHPTHPTVLFKGSTLTALALHRQSDAFAAALVELGIRKGDRVALVLPNAPQFLIAEIGAWKAGAVVVPLNPLYSERELEFGLASTGASVAIVLTSFYPRVKSVQPRTAVRVVVATSIKEYLPPLLRVLFTVVREKKEGHRVDLGHDDVRMQDLLRAHRSSRRPSVAVTGSDEAMILSSGGTTGTPKGVLGLHRDYVIAGLQLYAWTKAARHDWTDAVVLPLPLFHVYANVGVQSLALIGRNPLSLIPNPRDIGDVLDTIKRVRPTCFNGVPTLYSAILHHPSVTAGKVDLSSIRLCFSGAAPLLAVTKRQFEARTGARIIEGYSLTEGMMACCINPVDGPQKIGSIGIPVSDVEVRIVDPETGERELPAGVVGEMILRAPQRMVGYWNNPTETSETLRVHGTGGPWLHTGDLARMDDDGYIFIVDRKKDMLKTSGFQVWPREIEEVLATHAAVKEVGVAGIPDPVKGEVPKAWIVLHSGQAATAEELRAFCRERLTHYKVPAQVEFRDHLPKTLVGKILKRELLAEEKSRVSHALQQP